METEVVIIISIFAIVACITFYIIGVYNKLKLYENKIITKWNDIDSLINEKIQILSKTIGFLKGYIKEEEVVYKDIEIIINNYNKLNNTNDRINEYSKLDDAFNILYDIGDNDSKLKEDIEYNMLKDDYDKINAKIDYSKEFYNNEVGEFNNMSSFISNIVIKVFKFYKYNIFR